MMMMMNPSGCKGPNTILRKETPGFLRVPTGVQHRAEYRAAAQRNSTGIARHLAKLSTVHTRVCSLK